jgi:BirA family biotin operon repressor/biotin-[acetyl-CoA-carboxylase] ligase
MVDILRPDVLSRKAADAMNTREALLSLLKEAEGTWVSGDRLAKTVSLTRSAVWKHVCRLREEGCAIDSSPRKGYLLSETPDRLAAEEIRAGLQTRVFGRGEVVCLERTESTNTTAKSMALAGAPEGTLVVADTQTGGRGRKRRTWYSPVHDGLYASVVLRPRLLLGQAGRIPILASLALAETILDLGLSNVSIKWPNDILLRGKKAAGILTEVGAEMDSVDYMVVGLGVNVSNRRFPRPLQATATSLFLESGTRVLRSSLLVRYLARLEACYAYCRKGVTGRVLSRWQELSGVVGRRVFVETGEERSEGVVEGVDEDGGLVVRTAGGRRARITSGDIRFLGLDHTKRSRRLGR